MLIYTASSRWLIVELQIILAKTPRATPPSQRLPLLPPLLPLLLSCSPPLLLSSSPALFLSFFLFCLPLKQQLTHEGRAAGTESSLDAALAGSPVPIRWLLITNPHNPTGMLLQKPALTRVLRWARAHGVHIVSDEIYAHSVYDGEGQGQAFTSMAEVAASETAAAARAEAAEAAAGSGGAAADQSSGMGSDVHIIWGFSKDFCAS